MKVVKLLVKLMMSVILQILLFPLRATVFALKVTEKILAILRSTINHLISEISNEVK